MYAKIHDLLCDRKGDVAFTCFGGWHIGYILLFFAIFTVIFLATHKKSAAIKDKTVNTLINIAFGLYILDFFMMPFAYEMIDIEKLPFHICTTMCVMCFLSRRVGFLKKDRIHLALLGFISNLVYLIYPAGVMWYAVDPLCYRVVQTLVFHGTMTVYGLLAVIYDEEGLHFKTCYRDLIVLIFMTLWAMLGNTLYNGTAGSYSHFHNWFFVVQDPFGIFDPKLLPYIMPFLNIAVFFAVEMAVYAVYTALTKRKGRETSEM
ncbi:MAG: YwaF family protein [Lachnospiraceae bacterium]|nr:YwaF family protein [Lachnospiraceae bacterium]